MNRQEILKQIAYYKEKLSAFDIYGEDNFADKTVLRFDKKQGGKVYSYAGIKTNGLWFLTGARRTKAYTWEELTAFMAIDNAVYEVWTMGMVNKLPRKTRGYI